MGLFKPLPKKNAEYEALKIKYSMLEDKYLRLEEIKQGLTDDLDLLRKENQYYSEYIDRLEKELNDKKEQSIFSPPLMNKPDSTKGPRITNTEKGSLIYDKFPGKIGYIPKKRYDR